MSMSGYYLMQMQKPNERETRNAHILKEMTLPNCYLQGKPN